MASQGFQSVGPFQLTNRPRLQPDVEDWLVRSQMARNGAPDNSTAQAKKDRFFAPRLYRHHICPSVSSFAWKQRHGKLFDGGGAKNEGERQSLMYNLFDFSKDAHCLNGSASQVKEILPNPNGLAL